MNKPNLSHFNLQLSANTLYASHNPWSNHSHNSIKIIFYDNVRDGMITCNSLKTIYCSFLYFPKFLIY